MRLSFKKEQMIIFFSLKIIEKDSIL